MTRPRVLHLLSQRPSLTGSGITLDALVRHAGSVGWDQHVIVGVPVEEREPTVQDLPGERIHPLLFGPGGDLPFEVAGMSDVMPYPSTRFSSLDAEALRSYREVWRRHLLRVIAAVRPQVVHSHHLWLMSAVLPRVLEELALDVPVVAHCHATGLRQMSLCPHLAEEVRQGCRRHDRFAVLHQGHARELATTLDVAPERIRVVGAGYRRKVFYRRPDQLPARDRLLYVGKLSAAKGVPWLLDAYQRLAQRRPALELHVAGAGSGEEGEALRRRLQAGAARKSPRIVFHGMLSQMELAEVMRRCAVCVLPSFYEGLPLVLVEALACGCRLVATELPGVKEELAPDLGEALDLVPLPRLEGVDRPLEADLPAFVDALTETLDRALAAPPPNVRPEVLTTFTWGAVFERVEGLWKELVRG